MKKLCSCVAALTYASFVPACSDDDSAGGNNPADAAILDSGGASSTSETLTSAGNSTTDELSADTSESVARDAGTDATLDDGATPWDSGDGGGTDASDGDAALETDAALSTDAGFDAGSVDASSPDASDAGFGDAEVFIPDGGVVLRPTELPFDAERVGDLRVPDGFDIQVFANPGGKTRMLSPHSGGIYVTRPQDGDVLRLEDTDSNGVADLTVTAASGYPTLHGIAFNGNTVYLATATQLIRGTVSGTGVFEGLEVLFDDLPDGGQHPLRTLGIGPDGLLYLSVGSSCDACAETNVEHATLLQVALDGSSRSVFASGLRNTIGFGWHPETDQLWGMDNGSDWRGNELPPEELNHIEQDGDYGWPYCYAKKSVDPIIADPPNTTKAIYCEGTLSSVLENQAHEAPIGLTFYDGVAFPEEYRGDAFVAMHGSWNRIPATGYKIVRVVFDAGQPTAIEDFVDGFLNDDGTATFGRPAGITVDADGSLLFSDDSNGVLYRVSAE